MAAEPAVAAVGEAVAAGIAVGRHQHAFLQADQAVDQLEDRARRVGGHHRAVEHRLARVARDLAVVPADVAEHVHVDARAGHHREDLPGRGLDGHHRADLALHQPLAVLLQVRVDRGDDVVAGFRLLVLGPVLIGRLQTVAGVAQVDVVALDAAQLLLHRGLQAGLAHIVAGAVLGMGLDVVGVHFGDVAEQVAAGVEGILADAADLRLEAREAVGLLREADVVLGRDVLDEREGLPADAGAVLAVVGHPLPHEVDRRVQGARQRHGVEGLHVPRGHGDVVADFVAHQDLAVAVVDDPARRVDVVVDHRIVRRVLLVLVVDDLDIEQLRQQDGRHGHQPGQKLVPAVHFHRSPVSSSIRLATYRERAVLTAREAANFTARNQNGCIPASSTHR